MRMAASSGFTPSTAEKSAIALSRRRLPSSCRLKASAIRLLAEYSRPRPRAGDQLIVGREVARGQRLGKELDGFVAAALFGRRLRGLEVGRRRRPAGWMANRTMQMAARSDLIISTNPAVGARRERRIDPGLAQRRTNAAQDLFRTGEKASADPGHPPRPRRDDPSATGGRRSSRPLRHCRIVDRPDVDAAIRQQQAARHRSAFPGRQAATAGSQVQTMADALSISRRPGRPPNL